eukprot:scaffold139198_cov28-Tisochrysis_lutea.AAC.3
MPALRVGFSFTAGGGEASPAVSAPLPAAALSERVFEASGRPAMTSRMSSGDSVSCSSKPRARLWSSPECCVRIRRALASAVVTSRFTSASTASRPAAESFSNSSLEK